MKKIKAKPIIALVLALILTVSAFTVMPMSASAAGTDYNVSTAQQLAEACATINSNGGEHNIYIKDDFTVTGGISFDKPNVTVTFYGEDHTISFTGKNQGIQVWNGAVLNIGAEGYSKTLTLNGDEYFATEIRDDDIDNDNPGLLYITNLIPKESGDETPYSYNTTKNSVCNMYGGVTVKDRKGNNYFGGGVTVDGGIFHMYGGTIDNCGIEGGSVCYGGGVAVINSGIFIMDDGTISNCYVDSDYIDDYDSSRCFTAMGGGVFVTDGSTFTMNGGTITKCSATNFGGGVAIVSADSYGEKIGEEVINNSEYRVCGMGNIKSTATINGGTISSNEAGEGAGVFASGYFYSFAAPFGNYNSSGIGVTDHPGLSINGGEISSNASDDMGGGVLIAMLRTSVKAQIHNAVIKDNTADNGAGVENFGFWTQLDIDGCTITGNTADSNGGGVMASTNSSGGYTKIKDTTITGNTSGARGAGVYYDANSEIRVSGADIIQNNTYNGTLNNLNVLSLAKPVKVVGDLTGSQIGLSDPTLWDDNKADTAEDAVSTEYLTSGFKTNNDELIPAYAFTSDHESWYVDRSTTTTTTIPDPNSNTYREYTVKRYAYIPPSNAADLKLYPLRGQQNEYVYSTIKNPNIQSITSLDDIMNELIYRYSDTTKFTSVQDKTYQNGIRDVRYTVSPPVSNNTTTIKIVRNPNTSYIELTFSQSPVTDRGGSITYQISPSDQTNYANDGELVAKISSSDSNSYLTNKYVYSSDYTTKTVKYVNSNPPSDTLYEYNEFGEVTAKLEIVGGRSSYETKEFTTTTTTGTNNEVRLVRSQYEVNYHINNADMDDSIYDSEIFTPYVTNHTVEPGKTIQEFHNIPKLKDPDGYIFKGWYYADGTPVKFGEDTYETGDKYIKYKDIYAHWEPVEKIEQEKAIDEKDLPASMRGEDGKYYYSSYELFGMQLRPEKLIDENKNKKQPSGLRFATSIGEKLLEDIDALSDKKVVSEQGYQHNVEYGFVTASKSTIDKVVADSKMGIDASTYKIQYKGKDVNGVDTLLKDASSAQRQTPNNFRYVTNVDCTSQQGGYGGNDAITIDHRNCNKYRLATFVVTYGEKPEDYDPEELEKDIVARAYMRYYDANGLLRTFYNDYGGTCVYGGCCTNYNAAAGMLPSDPEDYNNQIAN